MSSTFIGTGMLSFEQIQETMQYTRSSNISHQLVILQKMVEELKLKKDTALITISRYNGVSPIAHLILLYGENKHQLATVLCEALIEAVGQENVCEISTQKELIEFLLDVVEQWLVQLIEELENPSPIQIMNASETLQTY
jgi:hypothetical protein